MLPSRTVVEARRSPSVIENPESPSASSATSSESEDDNHKRKKRKKRKKKIIEEERRKKKKRKRIKEELRMLEKERKALELKRKKKEEVIRNKDSSDSSSSSSDSSSDDDSDSSDSDDESSEQVKSRSPSTLSVKQEEAQTYLSQEDELYLERAKLKSDTKSDNKRSVFSESEDRTKKLNGDTKDSEEFYVVTPKQSVMRRLGDKIPSGDEEKVKHRRKRISPPDRLQESRTVSVKKRSSLQLDDDQLAEQRLLNSRRNREKSKSSGDLKRKLGDTNPDELNNERKRLVEEDESARSRSDDRRRDERRRSRDSRTCDKRRSSDRRSYYDDERPGIKREKHGKLLNTNLCIFYMLIFVSFGGLHENIG